MEMWELGHEDQSTLSSMLNWNPSYKKERACQKMVVIYVDSLTKNYMFNKNNNGMTSFWMIRYPIQHRFERGILYMLFQPHFRSLLQSFFVEEKKYLVNLDGKTSSPN